MKRVIASLLCVLILFVVPINAHAEDVGSFENAGAYTNTGQAKMFFLTISPACGHLTEEKSILPSV